MDIPIAAAMIIVVKRPEFLRTQQNASFGAVPPDEL